MKSSKSRRRAELNKPRGGGFSLFANEPRSWAISRGATIFILSAIFALGCFLRLRHMGDVASRSPDETLYTSEAKRIDEGRPIESPTMKRKLPYLFVVTAAMKITGMKDERAGSWVSCVASIVSLLVIGAVGVRFLSPWAAIYAMAFTAVSPLCLMSSRRCWQESIVECLGLILVWSIGEITLNGRWWGYAGLFLAGVACVTIKQHAIFLLTGALLYVFGWLIYRRAWRPLMYFGGASLLMAVAAAAAIGYSMGGANQLVSLWRHAYVDVPAGPQASWAVINQSGPWYEFVYGLWVLAPLTAGFSLTAVALVAVPARTRLRPAMRASERFLVPFLAYTITVMILALLIMPLSQNLRYLAPVYGALNILGGIGFAGLVNTALCFRPMFAYPLAAAAAALVLINLNASYGDSELLVQVKAQDLAIKHVLALPAARALSM